MTAKERGTLCVVVCTCVVKCNVCACVIKCTRVVCVRVRAYVCACMCVRVCVVKCACVCG